MGILHVVTRDVEGNLWHFKQSDSESRYVAQEFGPVGKGAPAVVLNADGVPTVLTIGPEGELLANTYIPGKNAWSSWRKLSGSNLTGIAAVAGPSGAFVVVARRADGVVVAASQPAAGGPIGEWTTLVRGATGRPTVQRVTDGLAVLITGPKGELLEIRSFDDGDSFGPPREIEGPPVRGQIAIALLPSQRLLVASCDPKGVVYVRHLENGKWSRAKPIGNKTGFSDPHVVTVERDIALISARDTTGRLWFTNSSMRWTDSKVQVDAGIDLVLHRDGSVEILTFHALHDRLLAPAVVISIDSIEPPDLFEGDDYEVHYTLMNNTPKTAGGEVSALPGPMKHVGPQPTPLGPWQIAHGVFKRYQYAYLTAGPHIFRITYIAWKTPPTVIKVPWINGAERELTIGGELEAFSEDTLAVTVESYRDRFMTDDPPDSAGPITCTPNEPDVTAKVFTYNFQSLARSVQYIVRPKSISDIQTAVNDAVAGGQRVRVLAEQPSHSSNAIICTEGVVISTEQLLGADPLDGSYAADLSGLEPVVEDFDGHKTVRVGPGMRLSDLMKWLDGQGLSLGYAVPGFRRPTVAGAVATGTHGSSVRWSAVISSKVRWLLVVGPDGTLREYSEASTPEDKWKALCANLGYLGVVAQLRLDVDPAFNLRVKTRWTSAKDLVTTTGPYELLRGSDWGEMMWFPQRGSDDAPVMVLYGTETSDPTHEPLPENRLLRPGMPAEETFSNFAIGQMESTACAGGDLCFWEDLRALMMLYAYPAFTTTDSPIGLIKLIYDIPPELAVVAGFLLSLPEVFAFAGPLLPILWLAALFVPVLAPEVVTKSYLAMSSDLTPFRPFQRDWEIFIPYRQAQPALQAAMAYFKANRVCLPLFGVFLRFAPAHESTLIAHTTAMGDVRSGEPGMFFEMPVFLPKKLTCSDQRHYEKVYSDLAEILIRDFGGRAHWGKNRASLFQLERRVDTYGDNLTRFRAVVEETDPKGTFANQFGIDMGLRWPHAPPIPQDTETKGCVAG